MNIKKYLQCITTSLLITIFSGCAVTRDQESVGAYIDDSVITTSIKSKFFEDKTVDGSAITVETLNGIVMLSGFVKNVLQKNTAENITIKVKGVKAVKNEISVKP
jgi:osmotically-inducible protein OsmY